MLVDDLKLIEECARPSWTLLEGRTLLLTGATGYIGRSILKALSYHNSRSKKLIHVTAISRAPDKFLKECPEFAQKSWLQWQKWDLSQNALPALAHRVDYVIHASGSDMGSKADLQSANVISTQNLLAHHSKPRFGFLYLSSGAALAQNPYGESKKAAEDLLLKDSSCPSRVARIYGVFGGDLNLNRHYAITQFLKALTQEKPIQIRSLGEARRSYLYIADLVIWLLRILTHGDFQKIYSVGSEQPFALKELASHMSQLFANRSEVQILGEDTSSGSGLDYIPDTRSAKESLGVKEWTSFDEGIKKFWDYQFLQLASARSPEESL